MRRALRLALALAPPAAPSALRAADPPPPPPIVRDLAPLSVRGVNYFPRETPWSGMWTKTPDEVWERDMALAASLGVNTIRTFLQISPKPERFSWIPS